MARDRATTASKTRPGAHPISRRALFGVSLPALGAAGFAAVLRRPRSAAASEPGPGGQDSQDDGGTLTAHRKAYYDRARF